MSQKTLISAHRPENVAKAKLAENWRPLWSLECVDCHAKHLGKSFRPSQVSDDRCISCHPINGITADAVRMHQAHFESQKFSKVDMDFAEQNGVQKCSIGFSANAKMKGQI